jgi:AcrR family transcriptional regulator
MPATDRPHLRADARRNRALVLAAAQQLLQVKGMAVQIEEIAEAAGVGVATVYRHFGNRDELITEVLRNRVDEVARALGEVASHPDPIVALGLVIDGGSRLVAADRGLAEISSNPSDTHGAGIVFSGLNGVLGDTLSRAQATGRISAGVEVGDVLVAITSAGVVLGDEARRRRLAALLLRGLGIELPVA